MKKYEIKNAEIRKIVKYTSGKTDEENCFPWDEDLENFVRTVLKKNNPEEYIQFLVEHGILEEPVLGKLRYEGFQDVSDPEKGDQKQVRNISDQLPTSSFDEENLATLIQDGEVKVLVLSDAKIETTSFGKIGKLKLDGNWYATWSKVIIDELQFIIEKGLMPGEVNLGSRITKTGRECYTLNATRDEEE